MSTPHRKCRYCGRGGKPNRLVCCTDCWRGLPKLLRDNFNFAKGRDAKIAAVKGIITHLTQQPELPL